MTPISGVAVPKDYSLSDRVNLTVETTPIMKRFFIRQP